MSRSLWQQIVVNITKYIYSSLFSGSILSITFSNILKRSGGGFGGRYQAPTRNCELFDNKAFKIINDQIIAFSIVKICAPIDTNTAPFPSIYPTVFSNYFEARYVNMAVMNG